MEQFSREVSTSQGQYGLVDLDQATLHFKLYIGPDPALASYFVTFIFNEFNRKVANTLGTKYTLKKSFPSVKQIISKFQIR